MFLDGVLRNTHVRAGLNTIVSCSTDTAKLFGDLNFLHLANIKPLRLRGHFSATESIALASSSFGKAVDTSAARPMRLPSILGQFIWPCSFAGRAVPNLLLFIAH